MSLRDRPKLSERLKGKTSDELFNEIKKEFEDKKNWFSGNPGFRSFKGVRMYFLYYYMTHHILLHVL